MRKETKTELVQRDYDKHWQVLGFVSSARMGLTNLERIKSRQAVDVLGWQTLHVTKNKQDAKKWLDTNREKVARYGVPYEIT